MSIGSGPGLFVFSNKENSVTRLVFQYLAIYSNKHLPKIKQIVTKWVENFDQNKRNLKYIAKDF